MLEWLFERLILAIGILMAGVLALTLLALTLPTGFAVLVLFVLRRHLSHAMGIVARALATVISPVLIGAAIIAALQLALNIVDVWRDPDVIAGFENAALALAEAFKTVSKPNAMLLVGAVLVLWIVSVRTETPGLVTGAVALKKKTAKVAAVLAVVSSFTFFADVGPVAERVRDTTTRLRAVHVGARERVISNTRGTMRLLVVEHAIGQMSAAQRQHLIAMLGRSAAIAGESSVAGRSYMRWVAESLPLAKAPSPTYSPSELKALAADVNAQDATPLREMLPAHNLAVAAAEKLNLDTRAAVEAVVGEALSIPHNAARTLTRELATEMLTGLVDADLGLFRRVVDNWAVKLLVDEPVKAATAPLIRQLADRLHQRVQASAAADASASTIDVALRYGVTTFLSMTERAAALEAAGKSSEAVALIESQLWADRDRIALEIAGSADQLGAMEAARVVAASKVMVTVKPPVAPVAKRPAQELAEQLIRFVRIALPGPL